MGLCKKYCCVGRAGRWLGGPGRVVLTLKTPYRDGTTHIAMSLLELMQRLAALVPRPRLHLIRFHGAIGASPARVAVLWGTVAGKEPAARNLLTLSVSRWSSARRPTALATALSQSLKPRDP